MRLLQRPDNTAYNEDPIVGFRAPIELLEAFNARIVQHDTTRSQWFRLQMKKALGLVKENSSVDG